MTQIKINYNYEVLLILLKRELYGRELAKELKTSLTRVQSVLNELRNINVVDYKIEGKNHLYFIKKNLSSKSFILNAENYKLTKIINKHPELEPIFEDVIKKSKCNLIILFGSYARGEDTNSSDIDIVVIERRDKMLELEKYEKILNRKIKITEVPINYTPRSFSDGKKIRARDGWRGFQTIYNIWKNRK